MLTPQLLLLQPAVRLYVPTPRPQSPPQPAIPATWTPSLQLDCLDEDVLPDVFSMLPHFADLSTFMIQQVINFAKEIPAFRSVGRHLQETPAAAPALMPPLAHPPRSGRSLPIDDQISLLKGATLEICQIQFNTVFNTETNAWECGQHCYTIQDGALGEGGGNGGTWKQGTAMSPSWLAHYHHAPPSWFPADLPGATAQVPHQPEEAAAARSRVRPAPGHAALLAR